MREYRWPGDGKTAAERREANDLRDVATALVDDWLRDSQRPYLSPTACGLLIDKIEAALVAQTEKARDAGWAACYDTGCDD